MKITKEELDSLIKEAAKDYVWGMKNISRLGNKYKLTTIKRIIREELEAVLDEKKKKKKKKKKEKKKKKKIKDNRQRRGRTREPYVP